MVYRPIRNKSVLSYIGVTAYVRNPLNLYRENISVEEIFNWSEMFTQWVYNELNWGWWWVTFLECGEPQNFIEHIKLCYRKLWRQLDFTTSEFAVASSIWEQLVVRFHTAVLYTNSYTPNNLCLFCLFLSIKSFSLLYINVDLVYNISCLN